MQGEEDEVIFVAGQSTSKGGLGISSIGGRAVRRKIGQRRAGEGRRRLVDPLSPVRTRIGQPRRCPQQSPPSAFPLLVTLWVLLGTAGGIPRRLLLLLLLLLCLRLGELRLRGRIVAVHSIAGVVIPFVGVIGAFERLFALAFRLFTVCFLLWLAIVTLFTLFPGAAAPPSSLNLFLPFGLLLLSATAIPLWRLSLTVLGILFLLPGGPCTLPLRPIFRRRLCGSPFFVLAGDVNNNPPAPLLGPVPRALDDAVECSDVHLLHAPQSWLRRRGRLRRLLGSLGLGLPPPFLPELAVHPLHLRAAIDAAGTVPFVPAPRILPSVLDLQRIVKLQRHVPVHPCPPFQVLLPVHIGGRSAPSRPPHGLGLDVMHHRPGHFCTGSHRPARLGASMSGVHGRAEGGRGHFVHGHVLHIRARARGRRRYFGSIPHGEIILVLVVVVGPERHVIFLLVRGR
mmetsp:Transcript_12304/g.36134  ORF Transcript_12304/g.36134 Transcript_12304/m.36134 type:complete len:454 (-) Transcript_12304:169-1530(-)